MITIYWALLKIWYFIKPSKRANETTMLAMLSHCVVVRTFLVVSAGGAGGAGAAGGDGASEFFNCAM